jgi:hypothetical protein
MLPLVGGVNVLLIIGIVVGIISLTSLFLTATSDPGVYLRSGDRGAHRTARGCPGRLERRDHCPPALFPAPV